jgi:hypothetical protein
VVEAEQELLAAQDAHESATGGADKAAKLLEVRRCMARVLDTQSGPQPDVDGDDGTGTYSYFFL